jgi:hypothetical protein
MGTPKKTVAGASRDMISGKDGELYRDINGQKGCDYYLRKDKNLRVFFDNDKVKVLYVIRSDFFDSPEDTPMPSPVADGDINAVVAKLDINKAKLDDVIRLFGKPQRYLEGNNKVLAFEDLPKQRGYAAMFGGGFQIYMLDGLIMELRFSHNPLFYKGKLRVGDSLEDALKVMGAPKATVVGKKLDFKEGVLYRDIDGKKGFCYYHRKDQHLRLWFTADKVEEIYVTRTDGYNY